MSEVWVPEKEDMKMRRLYLGDYVIAEKNPRHMGRENGMSWQKGQ